MSGVGLDVLSLGERGFAERVVIVFVGMGEMIGRELGAMPRDEEGGGGKIGTFDNAVSLLPEFCLIIG